MTVRERIYNLLTTVATLALLLGATEAAIRIYEHARPIYAIEMTRYANEIKVESPDPLIGHVHAPDRDATLMGVEVRINADGLRDRDYPVERNAGARAIFLG